MRWLLVALSSLAGCKSDPKPPPAAADAPSPAVAVAVADAGSLGGTPGDLNEAIERANGAKFGIEQGPWPGFVSREIEVISGDAFPGDIGGKLDYAYWDGVEACYLAAEKKRPGMTGRMIITFTIAKHARDKNGRVTKADAEGFDADIDACIEAKARRWSFHLMEGGPATFKVPIVLNRKIPPPPVY